MGSIGGHRRGNGASEDRAILRFDKQGAIIAALTVKLQEMVEMGETISDAVKGFTGNLS